MDDQSSSDDDIKNTPQSPKSGGKKLKLNDGSSQDSFKDAVSKDENIDSVVSADKSESTSSSDHRTRPAEVPLNEVLDAAPSTSNVHAILLNIRRPRHYRRRKLPGTGSDSNDSSRDSDDLSDAAQPNLEENGSESEEVFTRFMELCSSESENSQIEFAHSTPDNQNSASSDSDMQIQDDSDSGEDPSWLGINDDGIDEEDKKKTPPVLLKTRPKHSYFLLREIINREMGLTFPSGKAAKCNVTFEHKFHGSLHTIYRMKRLHNLYKHKGCVNSINFHPEGHLLVSGSDDTNVVIWDWSRRVDLQVIKTGHKSNVFQSKFLYLNAESQLNIVTCARDGQVRLLQCPPSGGAVCRRRLASHSRAAHKLHVCAQEPHIVISAGEDGLVMQCDVRTDHPSRLFHVKEKGRAIPLHSVVGHPLDPKQLLIAGRDKFVKVYDRRKSVKPVAMYCPGFFNDEQAQSNAKKKLYASMMHLTCAIYNYDGTAILGSYNDEDIYLFDAKKDIYEKDNAKEGYTYRYSGHRNSATYKGVSFFGPRSEYIVSGSDCGYIYLWEKDSESIVQWLPGDVNGVVNCIETHPRFPVMATSGLDNDIKIWIPWSDNDPTYEGLAKRVHKNCYSKVRSPLFNDFLPSLMSAWSGENSLFSNDGSGPFGGLELEGNVCTTF